MLRIQRTLSRFTTAPIALALAVGAATLGVGSHLLARDDGKTPPDPQAIQRANDLSAAFEYAADRVHASVVSINSVVRAQPTAGVRGNPFRGSPFEQLFNDRMFNMQQAPQEGLGSGFVIDKQGHIVTNNHVVRGADELTVTLTDKRQFKAKVIGADAKTDIAVIKIDADDLTPVEFGSSAQLRLGQWVIAAGNPFGLSSSITAGIVSAKGRSHMNLADYEDYIQTDAAINPGNSGGPLVDLMGRVVGMNTAIFTRTGGSMGIGFAIPMDLARPVIESLKKDGTVTRGWFGVGIKNLSPEDRKDYSYKGDGVLVSEVTKKSPAEEAGIKAEDILTKIDGQPVKDVDELRTTIATMRPGSSVEVELVRDGDEHKVSVEIGKQPEDISLESNRVQPGLRADNQLGLVVKDLNEQLAEKFDLEQGTTGVVITNVDSNSPADLAGLQAGDVILRVGKKPVANVKEFKKLLAGADLSQGVKLIVNSGGTQRIIVLQSER